MPLPDAAAWEALTKIGVAVIFLGMVVGALWKLGVLRKPGANAAPVRSGPDRVAALEKRFADLETKLAEGYIARADWVPIASRMMGLMERNTEMLARLDERTRQG